MITSSTHRLDAFTDAAFAFAVSLMVAGAGGVTPDYHGLVLVMKTVPSFAIGFAIIGMFWFAHVRWRGLRGEGDWRSVLLTFLLVFTVLVYVHPLRAMSSSFAAVLSGRPDSYGGHLADMFAIYGLGFITMALIVCALYRDALRNPLLDRVSVSEVRGQMVIWAILAATGLISTVMTFFPTVSVFAPMVYATLPLSIGLFAARWDWDGKGERA